MNSKQRILFLLICSLFILTGCQEKTYTKTELSLDTVVTITLYQGGSQEILDQAFELIQEYNDKLDAFNPQSEIGRLSSEKQVLDEDIYSLLKTNLVYSKKTQGLFSPALGSLIKLWDIQEPEIKEAPTEEQVTQALEHTNTENVVMNDSDHSVQILDALESINLGASSKGFIADKVKAFLEEKGVTSGLINLGGNVLLIGNHEGKDFRVGVDNPNNDEGGYIGVLELANKSIVTSGSYQRYFTDSSGKKYHHILDPTTGYPAETGLDEVVIVSDNSLTGDILSTTFFVMGKDKSLEYLKDYPEDEEIGILFVTQDGKIFVTDNLKNSFSLEPEFENRYTIEQIS